MNQTSKSKYFLNQALTLAAIYSLLGSFLYSRYHTMKTKGDGMEMFHHKKKKEPSQIDKIMKT